MLKFQCARCSQRIGVPDSYEGRRVRCPKCSRVLAVPRIESDGGQSYAVRPEPSSPGSGPPQAESAWKPASGGRGKRSSVASAWSDYLRASKAAVLVSWLIILFGTFWLLSELGHLPPLHWLWTLGLASTGVLTMLVGGINKQTLVVGPYLMICAGFSVLRQTDNISLRVEIPCLVIAFGVWFFIIIMCGYALPDLISDD